MSLTENTTASQVPDAYGKFGPYGGQFVPETLMPAVEQLIQAYDEAKNDAAFMAEFEHLLRTYVGRPSPITHAKRLSQMLGGAQIYLKREDLNHSGAHKINNALGQALLAKRMGKQRIVAETGAIFLHRRFTERLASFLDRGHAHPE